MLAWRKNFLGIPLPPAGTMGLAMKHLHARYTLKGLDLFNTRNRNEKRVILHLKELLEKPDAPYLIDDEIFDIYAFALNKLPARYAQTGTIILRDPVTKEDIEDAVAEAIKHVISNPKD